MFKIAQHLAKLLRIVDCFTVFVKGEELVSDVTYGGQQLL